jgi:prepilin-type processing-associated H-X9-DG protein
MNPLSICRPLFGVYMDREVMLHYPAAHHNNGGAFSFADGRVESHRWRDPRVIKPPAQDFHAHSQPLPNSPDLQWLQAHATIKR